MAKFCKVHAAQVGVTLDKKLPRAVKDFCSIDVTCQVWCTISRYMPHVPVRLLTVTTTAESLRACTYSELPRNAELLIRCTSNLFVHDMVSRPWSCAQTSRCHLRACNCHDAALGVARTLRPVMSGQAQTLHCCHGGCTHCSATTNAWLYISRRSKSAAAIARTQPSRRSAYTKSDMRWCSAWTRRRALPSD